MAKLNSLKILFVFAIALFHSCAEPSSEIDTNNETEIDSMSIASTSAIAPDKNYYPIPSPEDMFDFIKLNQVNYNQTNNQEVAIQRFQTEKEKATAFGVYSTNLAYVAAYDDVQLSIIYYKAIKQLASDLGIEGAISQNTMDQIQQKLDQPDSILPIINATYRESIAYLEENKRGSVMAIIAASGWLESMHIVLNTLDYSTSNSSLLQRIADQKLVFGNLWSYLKVYEDNKEVNELMVDLLPIRSILAGFEEVKSGNVKSEQKGKKVFFGGGIKIEMTKNQYEELKTAVQNIRAELLKQ